MSETKDFKIERGATWNFGYGAKNNDGSPRVGLTSLVFEIRNEIKSAVLKTLELGNGIAAYSGDDPDIEYEISLTYDETDSLTRDHYHYKLIETYGTYVYIPISGKLLMNDGG